MRGLAATLLAASVLFLAGCAPKVESGVWSWTRYLRREDGGEFAVDRDVDRPIVLVFWADWAGPCQPLLAEIGQLQGQARVVAVQLDSPPWPIDSAPGPQLEKVYATSDTLVVLLDIGALPTTIVLDQKGREVLRIEGSGGSVMDKVRKAIAGADEPGGGP